MEKIAAADRIFHAKIDNEKKSLMEVTSLGFKLDKEKIRTVGEAGILLYEILKEYGFNYQQVKDIVNALDGQSGKSFYSPDYILTIDRQNLYVDLITEVENKEEIIDEEADEVKYLNHHLSFNQIDESKVRFSGDENIAFLDFDKLKFPLVIRLWREGDRFQPLGMNLKKKLSDFMIDEKIPLNLKKQVPVLISGEEIVWVVGYRIDDRFKITSETRTAFRIVNKFIDDQSI